MDYNNNPPSWDGTRSYTSLMASYALPIEEGSASLDVTYLADPHADAFGVDHADDMDQSEEDEDDEIGDIEKALTEEAPNPNWNVAIEPDPVQMNSWQTWNATSVVQDEGEFARDQIFSSFDKLKVRLTEYSPKYNKPYLTAKSNREWYKLECDRKELYSCP